MKKIISRVLLTLIFIGFVAGLVALCYFTKARSFVDAALMTLFILGSTGVGLALVSGVLKLIEWGFSDD